LKTSDSKDGQEAKEIGAIESNEMMKFLTKLEQGMITDGEKNAQLFSLILKTKNTRADASLKDEAKEIP